jgi:hypothetical protein
MHRIRTTGLAAGLSFAIIGAVASVAPAAAYKAPAVPQGASARAANSAYDEYFASRVEAVPGQSHAYYVLFTPTKNQYAYTVQFAGKNIEGGNACWSAAPTHPENVKQLVSEHVVIQAGGELKASGGMDNIKGSAGASGSVNSTKDFQINRVYGAEYDRNPLIVFRSFHYRVIVRDLSKDGALVYTTPWMPGGKDIKSWAWSGDCSWVKQ